MIDWYEAKQFVERATDLSMDALHLAAGVFLLLGFSILMRRSVTDLRPWLAVLLVTLINEAADLWVDRWPSPAAQFGEAFKDIVVTMVLPTTILLTARHLPELYARRLAGKEAGASRADDA